MAETTFGISRPIRRACALFAAHLVVIFEHNLVGYWRTIHIVRLVFLKAIRVTVVLCWFLVRLSLGRTGFRRRWWLGPNIILVFLVRCSLLGRLDRRLSR